MTAFSTRPDEKTARKSVHDFLWGPTTSNGFRTGSAEASTLQLNFFPDGIYVMSGRRTVVFTRYQIDYDTVEGELLAVRYVDTEDLKLHIVIYND